MNASDLRRSIEDAVQSALNAWLFRSESVPRSFLNDSDEATLCAAAATNVLVVLERAGAEASQRALRDALIHRIIVHKLAQQGIADDLDQANPSPHLVDVVARMNEDAAALVDDILPMLGPLSVGA